jgi:large subunit ribosomal protein L24e
MPRNRECDYCGTDIEPGTGTMFVRVNGSTVHYCSSKCEKNANLGRESRDLEWAGEEADEAADTDADTDADDEHEEEETEAQA